MDCDALFSVETPAYIVDEKRLIENLEILRDVSEKSGCKILLAQKAFALPALYPLIGKYLDGTTASGLFEAKLGFEEMGKETHVFCAAYKEAEFEEIAEICDHISFNSFSQWEKFRETALRSGKSCGIRINPECSTQGKAIYDPCAPKSRLGATISQFREDLIDGLEGLHFHTLCEQNSDALVKTLAAVEEKFGRFLPRMKWVNFGGGHHISRRDYDRQTLIETVVRFREKYKTDVYLEPGEAVAYQAGYLTATVIDIVQNEVDIALLDVSAACHMPDVLEMPYRPPLWGSGLPGEKRCLYRLTGSTCLAGDIIGDYSFDQPLEPGSRLIFEDAVIYSFVKNNTFNGMPLPSLAVLKTDGTVKTVRKFNYDDFKRRLS